MNRNLFQQVKQKLIDQGKMKIETQMDSRSSLVSNSNIQSPTIEKMFKRHASNNEIIGSADKVGNGRRNSIVSQSPVAKRRNSLMTQNLNKPKNMLQSLISRNYVQFQVMLTLPHYKRNQQEKLQIIQQLKELPYFKRLTLNEKNKNLLDEILPKLVKKMKYQYCLKGETIYHEDQTKEDNVYLRVILKGQVGILQKKSDQQIQTEFNQIRQNKVTDFIQYKDISDKLKQNEKMQTQQSKITDLTLDKQNSIQKLQQKSSSYSSVNSLQKPIMRDSSMNFTQNKNDSSLNSPCIEKLKPNKIQQPSKNIMKNSININKQIQQEAYAIHKNTQLLVEKQVKLKCFIVERLKNKIRQDYQQYQNPLVNKQISNRKEPFQKIMPSLHKGHITQSIKVPKFKEQDCQQISSQNFNTDGQIFLIKKIRIIMQSLNFIKTLKELVQQKQKKVFQREIFPGMAISELKKFDNHFISENNRKGENEVMIFRSQLVNYLELNDDFMEDSHSLYNQKTVICTQNTQMLLIHIYDYEQQLQKIVNRRNNQQSTFLRNHYLFNQISNERFMSIFKSFYKMSKLSLKYIIYQQQKSKSQYFYLIKKGEVQIEFRQETFDTEQEGTRSIHYKRKKRVEVINLEIISEGQYFGHEDLLDNNYFRTTSAVVITNQASIFRIDKKNFMQILVSFPHLKHLFDKSKQQKKNWQQKQKDQTKIDLQKVQENDHQYSHNQPIPQQKSIISQQKPIKAIAIPQPYECQPVIVQSCSTYNSQPMEIKNRYQHLRLESVQQREFQRIQEKKRMQEQQPPSMDYYIYKNMFEGSAVQKRQEVFERRTQYIKPQGLPQNKISTTHKGKVLKNVLPVYDPLKKSEQLVKVNINSIEVLKTQASSKLVTIENGYIRYNDINPYKLDRNIVVQEGIRDSQNGIRRSGNGIKNVIQVGSLSDRDISRETMKITKDSLLDKEFLELARKDKEQTKPKLSIMRHRRSLGGLAINKVYQL